MSSQKTKLISFILGIACSSPFFIHYSSKNAKLTQGLEIELSRNNELNQSQATCQEKLFSARSTAQLLTEKVKELTQELGTHDTKFSASRKEISKVLNDIEAQDQLISQIEADPQNEELKMELTKQYIESTHIDKIFKQVIDKSLQESINPPPVMRDAVDQLFAKYYSWDLIKPLIEESYSKSLTPDELVAMLRFNQTEAGKTLTEKLPYLNMQLTAKVMQTLDQNRVTLAKELRELKDRYERNAIDD